MRADPAPEWLRLRRSLEQADGFALYLVFTDWPEQVAAGRDYLADSLKLRTRRLRCPALAGAEELVPAAMAALFGGFPPRPLRYRRPFA